jgi:SsrA-binding protein
MKIISINRRASYDYELIDTFDAGVVLVGSEIKSICEGMCQLASSYAVVSGTVVSLINCHIAQYANAGLYNHEPERSRILLLTKKQIHYIKDAIKLKKLILIATKIYFNDAGKVKVEIALAKPKKKYDKRAVEKEKTEKLEVLKAMKRT